jgi:hypothetical protein
MRLHGSLAKFHDFRNLLNLHFFGKPQGEDGPQPDGQAVNHAPDNPRLFTCGDRILLSAPLIRALMDFVILAAHQAFPEGIAPASLLISGQVDGDAHQPGAQARFSAKIGPALIGSEKAVLGERIRLILVSKNEIQDPVNAPLVAPDNILKILFKTQQPHCRARRGHRDRRFFHNSGPRMLLILDGTADKRFG